MDFAEVRDLALSFDQGPTGDPFLDGRYDWQVREFGSPRPYYRLFYRLSEMLRPRMVVELGAWRGTGAAHWAPHAGAVVTIDHHSDPGDDENERWCLEAAQRYPNLHYVKGWTWDVTEEVQMFGRWIDVLFIDSWHHYDKAMRDWGAYSPKLRPEGALVVCDDLADVEPTLHQMIRFWNEISQGRERFVVRNVAPYPMGFMLWKST